MRCAATQSSAARSQLLRVLIFDGLNAPADLSRKDGGQSAGWVSATGRKLGLLGSLGVRQVERQPIQEGGPTPRSRRAAETRPRYTLGYERAMCSLALR